MPVARLSSVRLLFDRGTTLLRDLDPGFLPSSSRIILFRRRVDATAVLHLIEHESAGAEPEHRGGGVPRRRG